MTTETLAAFAERLFRRLADFLKPATTSSPGLMSSGDKIKLDGLSQVHVETNSHPPVIEGNTFPYYAEAGPDGSVTIRTTAFDTLSFGGTKLSYSSGASAGETIAGLLFWDYFQICGAGVSNIESLDNGVVSPAAALYIAHRALEEISFAAAEHSHAAADITSGTFAAARIPSLAASKITTGTFAAARIPDLSATYATASHTHDDYLTANSALNGSKITSGTVPSARLPSATADAAGILSYTNFRYILSSVTATAITALSTSYRQVVASISASASFKFTGSTAFSAGREIHVLIKNTSTTDEITVTLPNSGIYNNGGTDTLTIPAGGYAEVNAISDGSKIYLRAVA